MGYFTWNLELVSKYLANDCRSTIRSANHYTMFTMYFHPKTDSEHHHWILHIRISPSIKFHFKLVILIFGNKLSQKEYFGRKEKKVNITIEFCIFELVQVSNFTLSWQFYFFRPNLLKKNISGQKQKKWTASLNSAFPN